eukprot:NODE_462_length_8172_cov_0.295181.p5 type:complete len:187 gc:universal NODE_462_length_8172_cov_0.295181:7238-6678(-)
MLSIFVTSIVLAQSVMPDCATTVMANYTADPGNPECSKIVGNYGGGHTCHHTYNKPSPLEAGFGGCDYAKSSLGGLTDLSFVWAFAEKKGFMVKGGGNCFDVEELQWKDNKVRALVLDNGTANDLSIPVYSKLTGVTEIGPNCEGAVCPIGNVNVTIVGNVKAEFLEFAAEYAKNLPNNVTILHTY